MRSSFRLWASSSTTRRWNGMAPLRDQRFDPDELEELGVHGIVFDDHDSLRHSSLAEPDSALGGAAGNVRVTRVPLPAPSLSIAIVPPIRWTRDFVITRPSPAPWWRRR